MMYSLCLGASDLNGISDGYKWRNNIVISNLDERSDPTAFIAIYLEYVLIYCGCFKGLV